MNAALRPESNLHTRGGSLSELQKTASEVERLAVAVPLEAAMKAELALALWGIDRAGTRNYESSRVKPKKGVPRPTLNTEDL